LRLAEQLVDLRVGTFIEPDVPYIPDDADDLQRQIVRAKIGELFANGVLSRESSARQGIVDHGHIERAAEVALAEGAAFQQGDPQRAEIVGSADANVRIVFFFDSGNAKAT